MRRPWDFHSQLSEPRLRVIASTLLDVLYETELELSTPLDDAYTRGSTAFGRQRNAIVQLCLGGQHPWLRLTNAAMDITFEIEGIPCRFFADDPDHPKKPGYWRRNDADQLFPVTPGTPEIFRFIVEKATSSSEEAEVHFVGYDAAQQEAFRWRFSSSVPTLTATDATLPPEVDLPPARAKLPRHDRKSDPAAGDQTDAQG
jgi:hypothetical protein